MVKQYEIIKRTDSTNSMKSSGGSLARPQSIFSLKNGSSIHMQRWGSWLQYEDPQTKKVTRKKIIYFILFFLVLVFTGLGCE